MQKSFHATAHLCQFLQRGDCPMVLKQCIPILENFFPAHAVRSFASYMREENLQMDNKNGTSSKEHKNKHLYQLENDIYTTLRDVISGDDSQRTVTHDVWVHKTHFIDGVKYSGQESERDSIIFYRNGNSHLRIPGVI